MSITISTLDSEDADTWDGYVDRSPHGTIFHTYAALETQAKHGNSTLHPLVGYKGEEPVGIFPVFETHKGPLTFVFSPFTELHVPNLGPALLGLEQLKQRKREQRHERFIDGCIEWIDSAIDPHYVSIRAGWRYDDLRPFTWNGFDASPSYTYLIDLDTDEEELIGRFSQSPRRNIRNHIDDEYEIVEGGRAEIEWIARRMDERVAEKGKKRAVDPSFFVDLADRLGDDQFRPYVLRFEGNPVAGTILLKFGDTAHSWQGGARPVTDFPANELLEWHMLVESMNRGVTTFEIVDANDYSVNRFKTKFNPEVRAYHTLNRSPPGMTTAAQLYVSLRNRSSVVNRLSPAKALLGDGRS